ncbi:MAG: hypothetical protein CXR31_05995 [Geobacter sp.]|nr:MAG: hypothetical protein CXR31_05995 [Geobacter sp.]
MTTQRTEKCPLCGCAVHVVTDSATGYQQGRTYTILECEGCLSSFSSPLEVSDEIYGQIYANVRNVPGYNRYFRYAQEILTRRRPLDYLMGQEESYWAVAHHLRKRREAGEKLNILELGCGMGYFTHALAQDGFTVTGVDISSHAVSWAREHYGPYYACTTLDELQARGDRYDAIIMNQLIEHLPDVHGFMADAVSLLSPGGEILITTPNKSAYPDTEWETDLPPVHLWWFGEEALKSLAQHHRCTISFIDFAPFYAAYLRPKFPPVPLVDRQPVFDAHWKLVISQPIPVVSPVRNVLERTGIMDFLRAVRSKFVTGNRWHGSRGPICAAVLRRTR